MSRIADVTSKLGQHMLAGWILTDHPCTVCSIPMLRSAPGESPERLMCIQCEVSSESSSILNKEDVQREPSPRSIASTFSQVSTPPTEVSSTPSLPTFAPSPNTRETTSRRAQSDLASAEIGRRMLQGWAMLAEECPSDSCYGVPLVRPPKLGGGKDPRKECVICGKVYVFEKDSSRLDRLVPLYSTETPSIAQPLEARNPRSEHLSISSAPKIIPQLTEPAALSDSLEHGVHQSLPVPSITSSVATLDASVKSLDRTLAVLANKLTTLSSRERVDHVVIGELSLSMERVTNALRAAKLLRLQESGLHV